MMIGVSSGDLTKPHLYIQKKGKDSYHILPISEECCIDLCANFEK